MRPETPASDGPRNERRKSRRLRLAVPIHFSTQSPAGTTFHGQGVTIDISPGGVRFETNQPYDDRGLPGPQAEIALSITIPVCHTAGGGRGEPIHISGPATVVRRHPVTAASRQHTGARSALAVRFHRHLDIGLPILGL